MAQKRYAVAGGINIDRLARAYAPLRMEDSNPGIIERSVGGVGFNIARNLALLGGQVSLVSAVGPDLPRSELQESLAQFQINDEHVYRMAHVTSSSYLAIHDHNGEMVLAVNDMRIYDELDPDVFQPFYAVLNAFDVLVLDTNLNAATLDRLTRDATIPIICDPVSIAKAERIRPFLERLTWLKPNRYEAEQLTGMTIRDMKHAVEATAKLISLGVQNVCLSLGPDGCLIGDDHALWHATAATDRIMNATGAGDAMTAMLVNGLGTPLETLAVDVMAAAHLAMSGSEAVNRELAKPIPGQIVDRIQVNQIS